MSVKRQATTELNHDNWDQEDPKEEEDAGAFKIASKDVLEKRVIRTAKRRSQISGEENKKSVFSGFSGFNKTQPSSFDFLSNLTNGKNVISSTPKSDTPMSFGTNNTKTSVSNSGLFSTTGAASKPVETSKESSPLFGGSTGKIGSSLFGASQDSKPVNPFNNQSASSAFASFSPKTSENLITTQSSTNIFGASAASKNSNSPISIPTSSSNILTIGNSTPFKINSTSSTTPSKQESDKKNNETDDPKAKYYSQLKGLNVSVSDWIKQHVDKTPLCILSPIFKDYEKHLKEIQDEYERSKEESKREKEESVSTSNTATPNATGSPFANNKSMFSSGMSSTFPTNDKPNFSFGMNSNTPNLAASNTGIFGIKSTSGADSTAASEPSNGGAPFSFGIGKPFTFNSNIKSSEEPPVKQENEEDEDEPPKVEYTPVAEENSVYDKKCKIFVKKDDNFVDKGVGTLYVKKIEESGKHQLLVRANTSLGNVLLNLILSSSMPIKRMGKNNVMMVCIPTPDFKPPPVPILIRVKTSEEADDLLSTLDKYKS